MLSTDKLHKFTADTVKNYEESLEPDVRGDKVINEKKVMKNKKAKS